MTIIAYGTPDWSKPAPNLTAPIIDQTYNNPTGNGVQIGPFSAAPYSHIAISVIPNKDGLVNVVHCYPNGLIPQARMERDYTIRAGGQLFVTVPVILGAFYIELQNIDGSNGDSGKITVAGVNGIDQPGALTGVSVLTASNGINVGASSTVQTFPSVVVEGPATLILARNSTAAQTVNVWAMDLSHTYTLIAEAVAAAGARDVVPFHCPGRQLRVDLENDSGAAIGMFASVIVGP